MLLACAIIGLIYLVSPYKIADDLTIMSTEVWGQLPKAQDNDDTIDDAIAAAIAAHESDAEAHLGEGESLEAHRAFDIVDHPAGSVLTDKYSMSEVEYIFNALIESARTLYNRGFSNGQNGFQLQTYDGDLDDYFSYCAVRFHTADSQNVLDFDHDMLVEGVFHLIDYDMPGAAYFGLIDWNFASTFNPAIGLGFEYVGTDVRGFIGLGATRYTTDVLDVSQVTSTFYRVVWNASLKEARYYVNGSLVATISAASFSGADFSVQPVFLVTANGTDEEIIAELHNFYYSKSLL